MKDMKKDEAPLTDLSPWAEARGYPCTKVETSDLHST
jgi:hypothetical protein